MALEIISRLEKLGYFGSITFIDGSPVFMKNLVNIVTAGNNSDANLEYVIMTRILNTELSGADTLKIMVKKNEQQ